jgi:peptide/nickel transport system permease protein
MFTYVARRLIYSIPVLVVSSLLIFAFVASSTDPLEAVRMQPNVNQKTIQLVEKQKHLQDPMVVRYGYWVKDALSNDFGTTVLGDRPILPDLERVLGNTVQLIVAAEILSILLGCGIGILSAVRQYSWFDHSATTFSFVGIAIPVFWLALSIQILVTTLFVKFHVRIFYTSGLSSVNPGHGVHFLLDRAQHLALPVLVLSVANLAVYTRFMRASMLEIFNSDYVRTARGKGLGEARVIVRHAMRNALIPVTTLVAINFGGLFGGAVITETIFALDGMGRYFINALNGGDPYPIMAWLIVTATVVIVFNLIADLLLGWLDPRIRLD